MMPLPSPRSVPSRYGVAVLASLAALLGEAALKSAFGAHPSAPLFTLAIVVAGWWGGLGPALVATFLNGASLRFLQGSSGAPFVDDLQHGSEFAVFLLRGIAISAIAGVVHHNRRRMHEQAEAIRASEERLRLASEATEDIIWDWQVARDQVHWSTVMSVRFGWPEALPCTDSAWWRARIHAEDRERTLASLRAVLADPVRPRWEAEYRFRRGDGSYAEVLDRGYVLRDVDGRALRMIGATLDLSARRAVEAEVRHGREQLQAIIDTVPSLISYVDPALTYRWNSRGYERWFQRSREEITGRSMREVLGEETFERIRPRLERALAGEVTDYEDFLSYQDMGGRWVHAIYAPQCRPDGGVEGIVISVTDISERKRAEAAVIEAAEQRRLALEAADLGSWDFRFATRELFGDERCFRMLGVIAGKLDLGAVMKRVFPEDRGPLRAAGRAALAGQDNGKFRMKIRVFWPDDSLHWLELHGRVFFSGTAGARQPLRFIGVNVDVTESTRAQDALRESGERWRQLAEAMPQLVWTCRPDGYCDYLSSQWVAYTGLPEAGQLGSAWIEVVHPADSDTLAVAWETSVTSGEVLDVEFRIRRFDGVYRWFKTRAVPVRDAAGRIVKWYGSNTDIEELKRAEAAAVQAANQRTLALQAAGMGAWDWELRTGALAWSDRAFELFGVPRDATPSYERFLQCIHPEDRERVRVALQAALAAPPYIYQCEYRVVRPDGSIRWLFGKGAAQTDPISGEPLRMAGITVDVTERVLGAQEIAAARDVAESANRAKDNFLAALSHELRTPLTPVLFVAATQERAPELPAAVREDFAMIRRNIELEARLIDDLLDVTRITRGKLQLDREPTDLHVILRRSLEMLRGDLEARHLVLEVDLAAAHHGASADPVRLQQVFWNILKNAVKFTPEGGRISVHSASPDLHLWQLTITDSGLGITAAELPLIFDAFAQGSEASSHRFGGLGLGLAISGLLVQEHGGRIWAESGGRHQGATFHLELPLDPAPSAPSPAATPQAVTPVARPRRLLVVEDHEPTRQTLVRLLTRRGYTVATAENLARARELAAASTFDLMISDLGLPDGSGHELVAEFLRDYGLKAIALSGYGMEEDIRQSMLAGFLEHLTKPLDIEALYAAVLRALEAPAAVS